jgi:uncharacterized membrane protein
MMDDEVGAAGPATIAPGEGRLPFEGEDMGRILSLSDGIFAFAMTLLVLSLKQPATTLGSSALFSYLGSPPLQKAFLAYVIGFLIIGSFWVAHHRVFRHLRRWNTTLLWANMLFLITIAVEPFVIGAYIVAGQSFASDVLAAGVWAVTGGLLTLIWVYATQKHRLVEPSLSNAYIRRYTQALSVTPVIFAASIGVALANATWAEYLWIAGIVAQAVLRRKISVGGDPRAGPPPGPPGRAPAPSELG